jgi:hypothetical protein
MSKISFSDSDITRIRFSDKVTWGGNDEYTIIEEEMLENFLTTDEHINRLDFLRLYGVNWKGDLQFTEYNMYDEIFVESTSNSISIDDDSSGATLQIDGKGKLGFNLVMKERDI